MGKLKIVGKIKEGIKIKGYRLDDGKVVSKEKVVELINKKKIENARIQIYKGTVIVRIDEENEVKSKKKVVSTEDKKKVTKTNDSKKKVASTGDKKKVPKSEKVANSTDSKKKERKMYVSGLIDNIREPYCIIRDIKSADKIKAMMKDGKIIDKKIMEKAEMGLIKGIDKEGNVKIYMPKSKQYRVVASNYGIVLISSEGLIVEYPSRNVWKTLKGLADVGRLIDFKERVCLDAKVHRVLELKLDPKYILYSDYNFEAGDDYKIVGPSFRGMYNGKVILRYTETLNNVSSRDFDGFRDYDLIIDWKEFQLAKKESELDKCCRKVTITDIVDGVPFYNYKNKVCYGDKVIVELHGNGFDEYMLERDARLSVVQVQNEYIMFRRYKTGKDDNGEFTQGDAYFANMKTGEVLNSSEYRKLTERSKTPIKAISIREFLSKKSY